MKRGKENLTREDLNFMYTQRALAALDIAIGILIIYVLANLAMMFTKNVFLIGIGPVLIGVGYMVWAIGRKLRRLRQYWDEN